MKWHVVNHLNNNVKKVCSIIFFIIQKQTNYLNELFKKSMLSLKTKDIDEACY
jgi:hypothetical protein